MSASIFPERNKTFSPFLPFTQFYVYARFFFSHSIPVHCIEKRKLYTIQCVFRLIYNRLDYSKGNNYSADAAAAAAETTIHIIRIAKSENSRAATHVLNGINGKIPVSYSHFFAIHFILK